MDKSQRKNGHVGINANTSKHNLTKYCLCDVALEDNHRCNNLRSFKCSQVVEVKEIRGFGEGCSLGWDGCLNCAFSTVKLICLLVFEAVLRSFNNIILNLLNYQ